jgi:hypothetical protein
MATTNKSDIQKQLPQMATDNTLKASSTKDKKHHSNRYQEAEFKDRVYCTISREMWDLHEPLRKAADESVTSYYGRILAGNLSVPTPITITKEVIREVPKNVYVEQPLPQGKMIIPKSYLYAGGTAFVLLFLLLLFVAFKPKLPNLMATTDGDNSEQDGILSA